MRKLKADVLVTAIFLTAALLFFLVPRLFDGQMDEAGVEILLDGELLERYPLSEDRTVTVPGAEEGYNLVLVSGGTVKVTDADCPDRLCMKQKGISRDGESIICLPHRLVVRIQSQKESDVDAVTN
jgi:hypothetical protein